MLYTDQVLRLAWHDATCPESADCRSRELHSASGLDPMVLRSFVGHLNKIQPVRELTLDTVYELKEWIRLADTNPGHSNVSIQARKLLRRISWELEDYSTPVPEEDSDAVKEYREVMNANPGWWRSNRGTPLRRSLLNAVDPDRLRLLYELEVTGPDSVFNQAYSETNLATTTAWMAGFLNPRSPDNGKWMG